MSLFNHTMCQAPPSSEHDLAARTVEGEKRSPWLTLETLGERKRQNVGVPFFVCVFLVRWWKRPRVEPSFFFVWSHPQTKQNAQMSNNAAHRFRVLADVRGWSRQSHQTQNNKKEEQKKYPRRGPHVVSFFLCSLPAGLEEKNSESKFRSWDLWVMSPTR